MFNSYEKVKSQRESRRVIKTSHVIGSRTIYSTLKMKLQRETLAIRLWQYTTKPLKKLVSTQL